MKNQKNDTITGDYEQQKPNNNIGNRVIINFMIKSINNIDKLYNFAISEKEFKKSYNVSKKELKRYTELLEKVLRGKNE